MVKLCVVAVILAAAAAPARGQQGVGPASGHRRGLRSTAANLQPSSESMIDHILDRGEVNSKGGHKGHLTNKAGHTATVTEAAQKDHMKAMGEHDVKIDLKKIEELPYEALGDGAAADGVGKVDQAIKDAEKAAKVEKRMKAAALKKGKAAADEVAAKAEEKHPELTVAIEQEEKHVLQVAKVKKLAKKAAGTEAGSEASNDLKAAEAKMEAIEQASAAGASGAGGALSPEGPAFTVHECDAVKQQVAFLVPTSEAQLERAFGMLLSFERMGHGPYGDIKFIFESKQTVQMLADMIPRLLRSWNVTDVNARKLVVALKENAVVHGPGDMPDVARELAMTDAEGSARFLRACKRLHALATILDTQPCDYKYAVFATSEMRFLPAVPDAPKKGLLPVSLGLPAVLGGKKAVPASPAPKTPNPVVASMQGRRNLLEDYAAPTKTTPAAAAGSGNKEGKKGSSGTTAAPKAAASFFAPKAAAALPSAAAAAKVNGAQPGVKSFASASSPRSALPSSSSSSSSSASSASSSSPSFASASASSSASTALLTADEKEAAKAQKKLLRAAKKAAAASTATGAGTEQAKAAAAEPPPPPPTPAAAAAMAADAKNIEANTGLMKRLDAAAAKTTIWAQNCNVSYLSEGKATPSMAAARKRMETNAMIFSGNDADAPRFKRIKGATSGFDLFTLQSALPVVDVKDKASKFLLELFRNSGAAPKKAPTNFKQLTTSLIDHLPLASAADFSDVLQYQFYSILRGNCRISDASKQVPGLPTCKDGAAPLLDAGQQITDKARMNTFMNKVAPLMARKGFNPAMNPKNKNAPLIEYDFPASDFTDGESIY